MNRKPGFPNSSCSIKLPDGSTTKDDIGVNDDENSYKKRQQLIAFGHSQWGFDNWSWGVTKQDLDFADYANGKYTAGVVAFVSISVKSLGIHREDVGYATCVSSQKGGAIYSARKCSVTNALRETLLSFGGEVASALLELLETKKAEGQAEENSNNKPNNEIKTEINGRNNNAGDGQGASSLNRNGRLQRKDSSESSGSNENKVVKKETGSPQKPNSSSAINKNCSNSGRNTTYQSESISSMVNQSSNVRGMGPTANHTGVKVLPPAATPLVPPPAMTVRPPVPPPNIPENTDNEVAMLDEEEIRAERKRRQRQKQEEFKRKLNNI